MSSTKELILQAKIAAFQIAYAVIVFCLEHYVLQNKENDYIWAIPIFIISLVVTCNYILVSKKTVLTTIFSIISYLSISEFIDYIEYVSGLNPRYHDSFPFDLFIGAILLLLLYPAVLFIMRRIIKNRRQQIISTESVFFRQMEKVFILFIIPLTGLIVYCAYVNKNPERIIEKQLNFSLETFKYTIESVENAGHPNGDVDVIVFLKFSSLTKENIDYLNSICKQQSISKNRQEIESLNRFPKQLLSLNQDYYLYNVNHSCCGIFNIMFIMDTCKNKAVLYYQIM
jgi:hypothetical protein